MGVLWRLYRFRPFRWLYSWLAARGVTFARMYEYEISLDSVPISTMDAAPTVATGFEVYSPPRVDTRDTAVDERFPVTVRPSEWVIHAMDGDDPIGRVHVSTEATPHIHPLERSISVPGAFIRRVYVPPGWRNEGLGSALVDAALAVARSELEADSAHAMIAVDNTPSRRMFESFGFEPVRRHTHVRFGSFEWNRITPVD